MTQESETGDRVLRGPGRWTIVQAASTRLIETAADLFREYAASLPFDLSFQDFAGELARMPGDYAPPGGRLLLAVTGGQAVGCVALRQYADGVAEMKRLYVRPAQRGLGIGRALALAALAEAAGIGYQAVMLDTTPTMVEAQALYGSLGFLEATPYRHNPIPGTRYLRLDLAGGRSGGPP